MKNKCNRNRGFWSGKKVRRNIRNYHIDDKINQKRY